MDDDNQHPLDYYILPPLDMQSAVARLAEHNGLSLDAFRFDSLDELFALSARTPFRQVA